MSTKNDITGDKIQSKTPSKAYRDNFDSIFKKDKCPESEEEWCKSLKDKSIEKTVVKSRT
jgi:hypothetical protein